MALAGGGAASLAVTNVIDGTVGAEGGMASHVTDECVKCRFATIRVWLSLDPAPSLLKMLHGVLTDCEWVTTMQGTELQQVQATVSQGALRGLSSLIVLRRPARSPLCKTKLLQRVHKNVELLVLFSPGSIHMVLL